MRRITALLTLALAVGAAGARAQGIEHPPTVSATDLSTAVCDATREGRIVAVVDASSSTDCDATGGGEITAHCACRETSPATYSWTALSASDHGDLSGLSDDDHSQYTLLAGRSAGQTLIGGSADGDKLELQANSTDGAAGSNIQLYGSTDGTFPGGLVVDAESTLYLYTGTKFGSDAFVEFDASGEFNLSNGSFRENGNEVAVLSSGGGLVLGTLSGDTRAFQAMASGSQTQDLVQITSSGGSAGDFFRVEADGDVRAGGALVETDTHATEHEDEGADELSPLQQTVDTCADGEILKADTATTGKWICGSAGSASFTDLDSDYGNETITSDFDFSGGILEVPNSGTLPATCDVGDSYQDTSAASGSQWYLCESTDTWVAQGGGGGSSDPLSDQYHPDRPPSSGCFACEEWTGDAASLTWVDAGVAPTESLDMDSAEIVGGGTQTQHYARCTDLPGSGDWTVVARLTPWIAGSIDEAGIAIVTGGSSASPTQIERATIQEATNTWLKWQEATDWTLSGSVERASLQIAGDAIARSTPLYFRATLDDSADELQLSWSREGMTWQTFAAPIAETGNPTEACYLVRDEGTGRFPFFRILNAITDAIGE